MRIKDRILHDSFDPLTSKALKKALNFLGESIHTIKLVNAGGSGLIYKTYSRKYNNEICIKIPYFVRQKEKNKSTCEIRKNFLKEGFFLNMANLHQCAYAPKIYFYDKPDFFSNLLPFDRFKRGNYLIREYIDGYSLEELINTVSFDYRISLLPELHKMAKSLFSIFHKNSICQYVIGDITPRNIIVTEKDEKTVLKFIDFGGVSEFSGSSYYTGHKLGTGKNRHFSPEKLIEDTSVCDKRIDYFSYGNTAFYILFGEYPFSNSEKDREKVYDLYMYEYEKAVSRLSCHRSQLENKTLDLIIKCLDPDANGRLSAEEGFTENY